MPFDTEEIERLQRELCRVHGVDHVPAPVHQKLGIARNIREGIAPINGLRHAPEGDTKRWYLWAGEELSTEPDFFVPLHVEHLSAWCPEAIRFLGLPPGWRFLLAGDHEDVWYDAALLEI